MVGDTVRVSGYKHHMNLYTTSLYSTCTSPAWSKGSRRCQCTFRSGAGVLDAYVGKVEKDLEESKANSLVLFG